MTNIDFIIENYKRLSTDELISLAKNPNGLRHDIIPHLQSELLKRNKKEEAVFLSDYLIKKPKSYKDLTKVELAESIKGRIDSGESLESIKIDLKDSGINIFDIIDNETKNENKTFEFLTSLKEEGLNETEINAKMQNTFRISETETEILKKQLKNKGKQNLIFGYSIVIITGLLMIISLGMGGSVGLGGIIIIAIGIWRITEGNRQNK